MNREKTPMYRYVKLNSKILSVNIKKDGRQVYLCSLLTNVNAPQPYKSWWCGSLPETTWTPRVNSEQVFTLGKQPHTHTHTDNCCIYLITASGSYDKDYLVIRRPTTPQKCGGKKLNIYRLEE